MYRRLTAMAALAFGMMLLLAGEQATAQEGAKVVVLDFQDDGAGLSGKQSAKMADRLSGIFEKSGKYDVVPRKDFKAAVAAHEKATGQPCKSHECMREVARSLGANAVEPKVKKEGGGCAVSLGVAGGGDEMVAGGSVKGGCSMKGMDIGMDGAMLLMTHQVLTKKPLPDIEAIQAKAQAAAAGAKKEIEVTTDDEEAQAELDAAGIEKEEKVDKEAEARAKKMEEDAARKMGW